jgi:hypothetical protein
MLENEIDSGQVRMRARHPPDRGGDVRALDVRLLGASVGHRAHRLGPPMLDLPDLDEYLAELDRVDQQIVGEPARHE